MKRTIVEHIIEEASRLDRLVVDGIQIELMRLAVGPLGERSSEYREAMQIKSIERLNQFIKTSYLLGSNPLPALRKSFPKFSWEFESHTLEPGRGDNIDECHIITQATKVKGSVFCICLDRGVNMHFISVIPKFNYVGPHILLNFNALSREKTFLEKAGFIVLV